MKHNVYWADDFMITSLGVGTQQNATAVMNYETGIRKVEGLLPEPCLAGEIDWSQIPQIPSFTRLENLFIYAIESIQQHTPIDYKSSRVGIIFSTTKGNVDLLAKGLDPCVYLSTMAKRVADHCGITSTPIVISNACISGLSALIVASRLIDEGEYDDVVVVGGDLLTQFVVSGFHGFKSVSETLCKPYDISRNGLSMGEACGAVLLTSNSKLAGDRPILLTGGGITNDANHISGPSRTGDGLYYAVREAMEEAGVISTDISFISAHGTATIYNDEMESKAIALAELSDVITNSVKPYFGHTLGACGVIESILSVWQLRHATVFGTMGFSTLGVPMPMRVRATHASIVEGNSCLKMASGFGGCNAALILTSKPQYKEKISTSISVKTIAQTTLSGSGDFVTRIREEYHALNAPNPKFFKMDDQCKLGYVAVEKLLQGIEPLTDATRTAIIISNHSSSLETDLRHQTILNEGGTVSPAVFVYTLPNIVSGEVSIRHHIQGENTFFVQEASDGFVQHYAEMLLRRSVADRVIVGWCDLLGNVYSAKFLLLGRQ